jgi:hypothetical protein
MKLITVLLVALPIVATSFFISNMVEKDYLAFHNPLNFIPKDSQFAKIIDGNTEGCLTKPAQTKPLDLEQIRALKTAKTLREVTVIAGNSFCETTHKTLRYFTANGKKLDISLDKVLDYDFSSTTAPNQLHKGISTPISRKPQSKL